MRIVTKTNLALAAVVAVSALLNVGVLEFTIMPRFLDIENQTAEQNQSRALEAIATQMEQVAASSRDYAFWDDSYAFMKGEGDDYEEKNVSAESMQALRVGYFLAVGNDGQVKLDKSFDFSGEEPRRIRLLSNEKLAADHPFLRVGTGPVSGQGLLRTEQGIVAVGYAPVLTSDRAGPSLGTLVFGRLLDVDALREATKVDLDLLPIEPGEAAKDARIEASDAIEMRSVLNSIDGTPLAYLVSKTDRQVSATGRQAIWIAMLLLGLGGGVLIVTLAVLLRRMVIGRIESMRTHLAGITSTGSLTPIPTDTKKDELSNTITSFNEMAAQLAELREQLRRQDYNHGAADQAAGILHNVRNALSPIATITWNLAQGENAPWKQNLAKAIEQLGESDLGPDRSEKLNKFVALSTAKLLEEGERRRSDLEALGAMVRHIESILKDEEAVSRRERVTETIDVANCVNAVSKIVHGRAGVTVRMKVPPEARVVGHRMALEQVLANLLVNAAEAVAAGGRDGTITVAAQQLSHGGGRALDITIHDDGEGFPADRLSRMFEKGFSTRRERSSGLGLHWCANAINAMKGRLWAESDGVGRGATLHVVVPAEAAEIRNAA